MLIPQANVVAILRDKHLLFKLIFLILDAGSCPEMRTTFWGQENSYGTTLLGHCQSSCNTWRATKAASTSFTPRSGCCHRQRAKVFVPLHRPVSLSPVLVRRPGKPRQSPGWAHCDNSGSQMNAVTLTDCHSVDAELTISIPEANGHSEIELGGDFFRNDPWGQPLRLIWFYLEQN